MNVLAGETTALDANGAATVTVAPPSSRQWRVQRVEIQVVRLASSVQPRAFLFKNANTPANQLDATYQGDRNTSDHGSIIRNGETLSVQWTGGTSGNVASVTVYGEDAPDTIELPSPAQGRGFESPIVSADPQQPGITTKTPIAFASAELFSIYGGTLTVPGALPFEYQTPMLDVREWNVTDLQFQWSTNTLFSTVSLRWFLDAAGTQQIEAMTYRTLTNRPIRDSIVNQGPYLQAAVSSTAGTYDMGRFVLRGRNGPLSMGQGSLQVANELPNIIARRDFAAIGAGVIVNVFGAYVTRGWATLVAQSDAPFLVVVLRILDGAGGWVADWAPIQTGSTASLRYISAPLALPPSALRMDVINPTGAAMNGSAFLMQGPTP